MRIRVDTVSRVTDRVNKTKTGIKIHKYKVKVSKCSRGKRFVPFEFKPRLPKFISRCRTCTLAHCTDCRLWTAECKRPNWVQRISSSLFTYPIRCFTAYKSATVACSHQRLRIVRAQTTTQGECLMKMKFFSRSSARISLLFAKRIQRTGFTSYSRAYDLA